MKGVGLKVVQSKRKRIGKCGVKGYVRKSFVVHMEFPFSESILKRVMQK